LSQFRFTFQTRNSDRATPNTAHIRVYNLKPETVRKIGTEYKEVLLQAGYETGKFGAIFFGTIVQTITGKERNVDTFVDIFAADGDLWHNNSFINKTIAAGATQKDIINAVVNTSGPDYPLKYSSDAPGIIGGAQGVQNALSRGKVLFGLSRKYATDWATTNGFRWSIQNGEFVPVPIAGYRPGEAVVLNSSSGLIGVPEATEGGVNVRALLNPLIRIGCLVQIAQNDIVRYIQQQNGLSFGSGSPPAATPTTEAGFYRVMTAEFEGDTRGQPWYVDMVCLAVDISASNQSRSVAVPG
jgi:hypothetical protein